MYARPIQPLSFNSARTMIGLPFLSQMSDAIRSVLQAKYAIASVNRPANSNVLVNSPLPRAAVVASVNAAPQPYIESAAIAGLPTRLVHRFDVRNEPTAASAAAAIVAAAGPCRSSNRKMK